MEFKRYSKILQFRNLVDSINRIANYRGRDGNNEPIYIDSHKPIITFNGSVKLHGINMGVCYTPSVGLKVQTHEQFTDDNEYGLNDFVLDKHKLFFEDTFIRLFDQLSLSDDEQLTMYGEYVGKKVQKGVAISRLENRSFFIVGLEVFNSKTGTRYWVDYTEYITKFCDDVYSIFDFKTYEINIDFNNPKQAVAKMVEYVKEIENECPVAKALGISGPGEGVVWKGEWNDELFMFKTKGDKHKVSKSREQIEIEPEVLESINDFVEYACTDVRIEQAIKETKAELMTDIPKLMKWISLDILTEEADVLERNNLIWKQVNKKIASKTRDYFFNIINSDGLM